MEPLVAVLGDRDRDVRVRQAVVTALGQLGDVRAVGLLGAVLQDYYDDSDVRRPRRWGRFAMYEQ